MPGFGDATENVECREEVDKDRIGILPGRHVDQQESHIPFLRGFFRLGVLLVLLEGGEGRRPERSRHR